MKDIDFDELDKAVSSVLSQVPKPGPAPKVEDPKPIVTEDAPAAPASPAAPLEDAPEPVAVTVAKPEAEEDEPVKAVEESPADIVPVKTTAAVVPARKAGRFMDMVHPSSDMATAKAAAEPSKRVSMTGRTLQPLAATEAPTPEMQDHPEKPQQEEVVAAVDVDDEPLWPDPIDLETPAPPANPAPIDTSPAPVTVPFVSDAKVEKRPLGAFSENPAAPIEQTTEAEEAHYEVPVVTSAPQAQKLPPEFSGDIVSVESEVDGLDEGVSPSKPELTAAAPATIAGTLSIPKQYPEQETPTDTTTHSLFDTDEYHPPLNIHAEHGNRFLWLWVVVAAILLLATAGLFAYWYTQGI